MMGVKGRPIGVAKVRQLERRIRNRGNLSYRQIAKAEGVGIGTISRIANGKHSIQKVATKRCAECGSALEADVPCIVCRSRRARSHSRKAA